MGLMNGKNPYTPKLDETWSMDVVSPVIDRATQMAQKLFLPVVTREISLFSMMQEFPVIVERLDECGLEGAELYRSLYFQYALYKKNGMNRNHIPADMDDSVPYGSNNDEDFDDEDDDRPDPLLSAEQQDAVFVDADVEMITILLEAGHDIAYLRDIAPAAVTQETYEDHIFKSFILGLDRALIHPVNYHSVYGATPLLADYLCDRDPDEPNNADLAAEIMDYMYPPLENDPEQTPLDACKDNANSIAKPVPKKDSKKGPNKQRRSSGPSPDGISGAAGNDSAPGPI